MAFEWASSQLPRSQHWDICSFCHAVRDMPSQCKHILCLLPLGYVKGFLPTAVHLHGVGSPCLCSSCDVWTTAWGSIFSFQLQWSQMAFQGSLLLSVLALLLLFPGLSRVIPLHKSKGTSLSAHIILLNIWKALANGQYRKDRWSGLTRWKQPSISRILFGAFQPED